MPAAFVDALLAHAVLVDVSCVGPGLLLMLVAAAFVDALFAACLLRLLMLFAVPCGVPALVLMLCLSRVFCVPAALVDVLFAVPCGE